MVVRVRRAGRFNLGQPEVQNFRVSARGYKDVRRLDVAMNDALGVRALERVRYFDGQRKQRFRIARPPRDPVLERHPIQKLHGNVGAVIALANFVDGADVGMVQGRGGSRLPPEALEGLRIPRQVIRQELQRHESAEFGVLGLVDDAHPAPAKLFHNPIARDHLANHAVGSW